MRLGTRKDGTLVAIDRSRAHPLPAAGVEGTMRELVELGPERVRTWTTGIGEIENPVEAA